MAVYLEGFRKQRCNNLHAGVHDLLIFGVVSLQVAAEKVSMRLQDKPRHPAQQAADVVERVLATDGDMYLQTREHSLSWWQHSLLDVKAFLLMVVLSVFGLLAGIVYGVCFAVTLVIRPVWNLGLGRTRQTVSALRIQVPYLGQLLQAGHLRFCQQCNQVNHSMILSRCWLGFFKYLSCCQTALRISLQHAGT